jgi:hypothetical protein
VTGPVDTRFGHSAGAPYIRNLYDPILSKDLAHALSRLRGLGHSIGSPTTTLPSATSNGNATKYVIPAMAHLLNRTSPKGRAARVQTFHARIGGRTPLAKRRLLMDEWAGHCMSDR